MYEEAQIIAIKSILSIVLSFNPADHSIDSFHDSEDRRWGSCVEESHQSVSQLYTVASSHVTSFGGASPEWRKIAKGSNAPTLANVTVLYLLRLVLWGHRRNTSPKSYRFASYEACGDQKEDICHPVTRLLL